jgi:hypothetical protein
MDTAVAAAEFSYPPQTASATVKAELLDCTAPSDAPESLVYWANWTVLRPGNDGSAEGSLTPPAGTIKIGYSGEVNAVSQTSDALFNNYIPESTYMSPSVANAPTNAGMIAVAGDPTLMQVLRFSSSIDNPLLAVWSLGFGASGTPATWEFDPAPTMLSSGPNIYSLPTSSLTVSDKQVTGVEGNGVLQFAGRLSAIAFRVPVPEMAPGFAGFTVGMRAPH